MGPHESLDCVEDRLHLTRGTRDGGESQLRSLPLLLVADLRRSHAEAAPGRLHQVLHDRPLRLEGSAAGNADLDGKGASVHHGYRMAAEAGPCRGTDPGHAQGGPVRSPAAPPATVPGDLVQHPGAQPLLERTQPCAGGAPPSPGPPGPPGPRGPPVGGAPMATMVAVTVSEVAVPNTATWAPTVTLAMEGEVRRGRDKWWSCPRSPSPWCRPGW